MDCLNCGTEMTNYDVITHRGELSYDVCEKCGSLWLDRGELDKMAFRVSGSIEFCSEEEAKDLSEPNPKQCPRCDGVTLAPVRFLGDTGIILHHCRNCGGFWLDGDQLNLVDQELARIMPVTGHGFSDFVNHVHVPYWFKRIRKPSSETDYHIEVEPISGAKRIKSTDEDCPACGAKLDVYSLLSLKFDGCPKCHGMWLEKDELRKLKNKMGIGQLHWLNHEVDEIEKTSAVAGKRVCPKKDGGRLVSVVFGKSSVVLDWCPKCHGIWLDRDEFNKVVDYLTTELGNASVKDVEREIAEDFSKLVHGGPEGRLAEIGDIAAAITTLLNFSIFEHPALMKLTTGVQGAGHTSGLD